MMKKNQTLILLAAAAAAAFYFMKSKGTTDRSSFVDDQAAPETDDAGTSDVNAVVTAAPGQIQAAVEKATEIAANVKDAVVAVTDGTQTAVVTSGKSKRDAKRLERKARMAARKAARELKRTERKSKRAGKWTIDQLNTFCTNKGFEQGTRQFKKCVRQARKSKSLPFVQPTQSSTF